MANGRDRARASSSASARGSTSATASPSSASPPPPISLPDAPVRVFPPSAGAARALQSLQSLALSDGVAAVGFLCSGRVSTACTLANRVIGRRAFLPDALDPATSPHKGPKEPSFATIHLFLDTSRRCVFLLGIAHATTSIASASGALVPPAMAEAGRERLKMETLLLSSCSFVLIQRHNTRSSSPEVQLLRSLSAEKTQLTQWMATSGPPGPKNKRSSSSNALAPGRCVPVAVYVVPAAATRSTAAALGRTLETRLMGLAKALRGGPVGSARLKDALTTSGPGRERRVLTLDPSHSVIVVSRSSLTGPASRLQDVLDALDISDVDTDDESAEDGEALDELLRPLDDEDDVGWPRAEKYLQRVLDHLQTASRAVKDGGPSGPKVELLTLSQWLKAFQGINKLYQRMDSRRRSGVDG